jgi:hypothetical protein
MTLEQAKEILKTTPRTPDEVKKFKEALQVAGALRAPV